MKLLLRNCVPNDYAFIFATYLRNRWYDKTNKTTLKRATWSKLQHNRLEKVLRAGNVVVLSTTHDKDLIIGYKLPEGWSYIKRGFRASELGAAALLEGAYAEE